MKLVQPYAPHSAGKIAQALSGSALKSFKGFGANGSVPRQFVDGGESDLPQNLEGACRAVEQQFMEMVLDSMRKATLGSAAKGSLGFSKDLSMSMLQTEVARLSSQDEGMGLWKVMYDQMKDAGGGVKSENTPAEKSVKGVLRRMGHLIG